MSDKPVQASETPTENPTQTPKISAKDQVLLETIKNLQTKFENEDQLRSFFTRLAFEKYWYVDIEEFRAIFGEPTINDEALGKIKKFWVEKNITYFNMSYELLWPVKWVPVAIKYATGLLRFRVMSMALLFVYLEAVDFFLEPMVLHYYKTRRLIKVSDGFDYHLTKGKYQEMRWKWFENYLNVIKNCIEYGVKLGPDRDKKLVKRMNPKNEDDELFQSVDMPSDNKKESHILFKKQIDTIKRDGILSYVKKLSQERVLEKTLKSYFSQVMPLYFDYKQNYRDFPTRKEFAICLHPKYFPGERLLTFPEELQRKTRTIARTVDYAIGKPIFEDFLIRSHILSHEEITRKEKQKLSISYLKRRF